MSSPYNPCIKSIACGRRKPEMSQKEYFDYRFQIHGSISDAPPNPKDKPSKYMQTQIFDSVFGQRKGGPFNSNQFYMHRDDVTELYWHDLDGMLHTFGTDFVRKHVGPDGKFFADLESTIILLALERDVPLPTELGEVRGPREEQDANVTATYFISTPDNVKDGSALEEIATKVLVEELVKHATKEAYQLAVNVGMVSDKFDLNGYFGGADMPQYALVFKIAMKDVQSVKAIRLAQQGFEQRMAEKVDASESFIVFGKDALVLDQTRGIKVSQNAAKAKSVGGLLNPNDAQFDKSRQPFWEHLGEPENLGYFDYALEKIVSDT